MKYNESKEPPSGIDDTNRKMRESYRRSVVRYSVDSIKDQIKDRPIIDNVRLKMSPLGIPTLKNEENQDLKVSNLKSGDKLENFNSNESEKLGFDINSTDVFKRHETLSHFNNKQKDDFISIRSLLSDRTKAADNNTSTERLDDKRKEKIFKFQITKKLKYSSSSYLTNKNNIRKSATKTYSKRMTLIEDISFRKTFKNSALGDTTKSPFVRRENTEKLTKTKKLEGQELNPRKSITNKLVQSNQGVNLGLNNKIKSIKKYDYLFSDVSPEKITKNAEKSPALTEEFNIHPLIDSPKRRNTRSIHSGIYSNLFI